MKRKVYQLGKKILAYALGIAVLQTSVFAGNVVVNAQVRATDISVADQIDIHSTETAIAMCDKSDEELFAEYVEQSFYESAVSFYKIDYGKEKLTSDLDKKAYDLLKSKAKDIADGKIGNSIISLSASELGIESKYTAEELGVSSLVVGDKIADDANTAFLAKFNVDYADVMLALLADCPAEFYWLDKTYYRVVKNPSKYGIITDGGTSYLGWKENGNAAEWRMEFQFYVSKDYSSTGEKSTYDVDTTKTGAAKAAVENAKKVVDAYADKTDQEKLTAYKEYICNQVAYNHDAVNNNQAYGDPWQMIYVFDENSNTNVVCEGYSKAFQYLCDLSSFSDENVYSILVTGTMNGGAHMWNVVHIGNRNYLVDVTNCDDGSVGYPDKLFLAGTSGSASGGYTFNLPGKTETYLVTYLYDINTKSLYGDSDLELSDQSYHTHDFSDCTNDTLTYTWTPTEDVTDENAEIYLTVTGTCKTCNHTVEIYKTKINIESCYRKAATCTEDGYIGVTGLYMSIDPLETGTKKKVSLPVYTIPSGHSWSEWTTDENGILLQTCNKCGVKNTNETISKPTIQKPTCTTVVLTPVAGYEYSTDKTNWQTSNVFSNLTDGTTYSFYQRRAAVGGLGASDASEALSYTFHAGDHEFGTDGTAEQCENCTIKNINAANLNIQATTGIYTGTELTADITGIDSAYYDVQGNKATAVGTHTITLVGKDSYYGTRYVSWSIDYLNTDDVASADESNKGENGWYKNDVKLSAPCGFEISAQGPDSITRTWSNNLTVTQDDLQNGKYGYYLKRISGGEITDKKEIDLKIDGTVPQFSNVAFIEEQTLSAKFTNWFFGRQTITVTVTASDTGSGLKDLVYKIDNGDNRIIAFSNGTATFDVVGDQTSEVTLLAKDAAGNESTTSVYHVCIDSVAPTITDNSNYSGWVTNADAKLSIKVDDRDSGVAKVTYKVDGGNETSIFDGSTKQKYTTDDISIDLSEGTHNYHISSTDHSGNSVAKDIEVKCDRTLPVISEATVSDVELKDVSAKISVAASDNLTTNLKYYVLYQTSAISSDKSAIAVNDNLVTPQNSMISLNGLNQNETYYYAIVVMDDAGLISDMTTGSFKTKKTLPKIIKNPTISGVYGQKLSEMLQGGEAESVTGNWTVENGDSYLEAGTTAPIEVTFTPGSEAYDVVKIKVTPSVSKKQLTLTIDNKTKKYGENNPELTYTNPDGGLVAGNSADVLQVRLATTARTNSDVGSYDITGSYSNNNYDITFVKGTLTIEQANNTVTPEAPTIHEYTDTMVTLVAVDGYEYSKNNGTDWQTSNVFTDLAANTLYTFCQRVAATKNVKASAKSAETSQTTKKTMPIITKQPVISGEYGKTVTEMLQAGTAKVGGTTVTGGWSVLNGDSTYLQVGDKTPITVTFTPAADAYDSVTTTVVPSVTKKPLTIKINDASRSYNVENPAFTTDASNSLLVAGDTDVNVLGITLSTTATKTSNVGTYDVTGTSNSTNYDVTFTKGTLTITKGTSEKPSAPVISDENILDTQITITKVDGCEYSKDGSTWQDSNVFTGLIPNTSYTFYQRVKETTNYSQSDKSDGTEKITKKTIPTITNEPTISGTYGETLQSMLKAGTASVDGSWSVANGSTIPDAGTTNPIEVTFTPAEIEKYSTLTVSVIPSVTKRVAKLDWSSVREFEYDGNAHEVTATINNLLSGDDVNVATYEANSNINAGTYTAKVLTLSGAKANNYCLPSDSTNACQYVINKYDITGKTIAIELGTALTYNGTEQTQTITSVQLEGNAFTSYTVSGNKATNVGNYMLTVTGTGNYAGTATEAYTVAKANPTITLGKLSQTQGSTSAVTATLNPASSDAHATVEYKVISKAAVAASACKVTHVATCASIGAKDITMCNCEAAHIAHDSSCGYAAASDAEYKWTTAMPTAVGSYEVRAYLLSENAGANLIGYSDYEAAKAAGKVATGTLVISKKSSGGNTGGSTGGNTGGSSGGSTGGSSGGSSGGSTGGGSSTGTEDQKDDGKKEDSKPDTTTPETVTNKDGSTTTTTVETAKDGSTVKTETTTKTDGSEKTVVTETAKDGDVKTTTTLTDKNGSVTSVTEKTVLKDVAKDTEVTVVVKKDGNGEVTTAKATITTVSDSKKAAISGTVAKQVTDTAGTDTQISMKVTDKNGKQLYTVKADSTDLEAGNKLYIYKLDTKTNKYTMVDAKTYKVSKDGSVSVNPSKKATYELVNAAEAKAIEKQIKATIKPKKANAKITVGKKVQADLAKSFDMDNVKKITYSTSNAKVAKVSKNGTVQAKKAGTATVKVKVILKNGSSKTVNMKITVKK